MTVRMIATRAPVSIAARPMKRAIIPRQEFFSTSLSGESATQSNVVSCDGRRSTQVSAHRTDVQIRALPVPFFKDDIYRVRPLLCDPSSTPFWSTGGPIFYVLNFGRRDSILRYGYGSNVIG